MFNYKDLSDFEFEELCKDIMERKLSMNLRIYTSGRDRGIDLSDYEIPHQTIVQIKHYMNSTYSSLKTSLGNEIKKVEKLNPRSYYICVSKSLTEANTEEIYEMFANYMDSTNNIVDLKEIDAFLADESNSDILRKHYKLWLHSTGILSEIYNQNIFIDCEALLSNIDIEKNYFIQTNIYDTCFKHLMRDRIIFMTGAPGVGKTITSKMLLLECASKGYKVKYTTNANLTDIKRSLSADKNIKEIILLDDCLGQHYFKMNENKESELLSLIKYVQMNKKKKLIMNSRIAIFNEARG
ncbi:TPA: AAA family ATPase, partial [Listeria innocua]